MNDQMLNRGFSKWFTRQLTKVVNYARDRVNLETFGMFREVVDKWADRINKEILDMARTMAPIEPTMQEQAILNAFVDKLKVFFVQVLVELENANNDINVINTQLAKIGIVQKYFTNNETNGLSSNAINLRNDLISELILPIEEFIQQNAGRRIKVTSSVIANQALFTGLISNSITGLTYPVTQYILGKTNNGVVVVPQPVPVRAPIPGVITLPPAGIKTLSPTKSDLAIIPDSMYIKNLPISATAIVPKKINITGFVYDDKGVIPGANITIGKTSYTPTDINGKFSLKNIDDNATVSVSFMGYKTKTINANRLAEGLIGSNNRIILETDTEVLNELEIKNLHKKKSLWWVLLLVGAVTIGGYLYTRDPETKKIIKTKI